MNETLSRIVTLSRGIVVVLAVVGTVVVGTLLGLPLALLFAAAAVLVLVISLLWTSVQSLSGQTPLTLEEAIGLGAPSAEEERKRAVLRALKDLEYERSVGKISDEDYRELAERYRAEAKALLKALDADHLPEKERAEKLLQKRLKAEGITVAAATSSADDSAAQPEAESTSKAEAESASPAEAPETSKSVQPPDDVVVTSCAGCGTRNDSDARFCKRCGTVLAAEPVS